MTDDEKLKGIEKDHVHYYPLSQDHIPAEAMSEKCWTCFLLSFAKRLQERLDDRNLVVEQLSQVLQNKAVQLRAAEERVRELEKDAESDSNSFQKVCEALEGLPLGEKPEPGQKSVKYHQPWDQIKILRDSLNAAEERVNRLEDALRELQGDCCSNCGFRFCRCGANL